jgi:hypothetical protein
MLDGKHRVSHPSASILYYLVSRVPPLLDHITSKCVLVSRTILEEFAHSSQPHGSSPYVRDTFEQQCFYFVRRFVYSVACSVLFSAICGLAVWYNG